MKKVFIAFLAVLALGVLPIKAENPVKAENRNYMWFDCEANYVTLSCPDSIRFYLEKVKKIGFDNVVVDMKSGYFHLRTAGCQLYCRNAGGFCAALGPLYSLAEKTQRSSASADESASCFL